MRAQSRVVNADSTLSDRIKPGFALRNINAQTFEAVSFTVTDARQIQSVIRFPPDNHPHRRTVPALPDRSGGAILPQGATVRDDNPTFPLDNLGGACFGPGEGHGAGETSRRKARSARVRAGTRAPAKAGERHTGATARTGRVPLDGGIHVRVGELAEAPDTSPTASFLAGWIGPRGMFLSGG